MLIHGDLDVGVSGMGRRVPSFMNLDEDFSSLPVFGVVEASPLDMAFEQMRHEPTGEDEGEQEQKDKPSVSPDRVSVEESDEHFFVQQSVRERERERENWFWNPLVLFLTPASPSLCVQVQLVATPNSTLHNGVYNIENIPSAEDIERMSGPLLRGYLKSVGISKKGKRSDLMNLLIDEFVRYREDPELYLQSIADVATPAPFRAQSRSKQEPLSSGRRTKKRSLRAREADELLPSMRGASSLSSSALTEGKKSQRLALSASPPPALEQTAKDETLPTTTTTSSSLASNRLPDPMLPVTPTRGGKKRSKSASAEETMTDSQRLERYESIARQVVRSTMGQKDLNPSDLLIQFSSAFGFNAHGIVFSPTEENDSNPSEDDDDLIGSRVEVLWVEDLSNKPMWYAGTIVSKSDGLKPFFTVLYDDGEERVENLRNKRWRFCPHSVKFVKISKE